MITNATAAMTFTGLGPPLLTCSKLSSSEYFHSSGTSVGVYGTVEVAPDGSNSAIVYELDNISETVSIPKSNVIQYQAKLWQVCYFAYNKPHVERQ
jgi:hypothetical protein